MKNWWIEFLDYACTALVAIVTAHRATLPVPPASPVGLAASLQAVLSEHFVAIIIILVVCSLGSKIALTRLRSETKYRLKAVLDIIRDSYFRGTPETEKHLNRVTLFRRTKGTLVPFCRSGTAHQRGSQKFAIDDDHEERNEGIAGKAWFTSGSVTKNDLPEPPGQWDNNDARCKAYAEAGNLPIAKAAKLRVKAQSIHATVIRTHRGERWGVLVLDSAKRGQISEDRLTHVELLGTALGKML